VQQGVQAGTIEKPQHRVAQADPFAVVQHGGPLHDVPVQVGAVGRAQVPQFDLTRADPELDVAPADARRVDAHLRLHGAPDHDPPRDERMAPADVMAVVLNQARAALGGLPQCLQQRDVAAAQAQGGVFEDRHGRTGARDGRPARTPARLAPAGRDGAARVRLRDPRTVIDMRSSCLGHSGGARAPVPGHRPHRARLDSLSPTAIACHPTPNECPAPRGAGSSTEFAGAPGRATAGRLAPARRLIRAQRRSAAACGPLGGDAAPLRHRRWPGKPRPCGRAMRRTRPERGTSGAGSQRTAGSGVNGMATRPTPARRTRPCAGSRPHPVRAAPAGWPQH
jgi:hypothetical protein